MTLVRAISRPLSRPLARRPQDSSENAYASPFDPDYLPLSSSRLAEIKSGGSGAYRLSVIGDSLTEAANADVRTNGWVDKMAEGLRAYLGYPSSPHTRFYSANYISGSESWTYSGTASTPSTIWGYGFRHRELANGSVATLVFTGTDIDVYLIKAFTVGGGTYTIDGGAPVAWSANLDGSNRRFYSDPVISISGLSAGLHTIVITATGAGVLEGAYVYNGDKTNGVHVWECGHGGFKATDYALQNAYMLNASHVLMTQADLCIIALGINDYRQSVTKANYGLALRRIVMQLRQTRPQVSLVLVKEHTTVSFANPDDAVWANWKAVVDSVGATYGIPVWDWDDAIGSFASPGNPNDSGDQIHANTAGHAALGAQAVNKITASVGVDQHAYRIVPASAYEADGPNLLTNLDISTWTNIQTPIVTTPGGTIDGHTIYRIQDDHATQVEGKYVVMPTLLANRRYRMTIQACLTDWAVVSGGCAALLQISDGSNGINSYYDLALVNHTYGAFGSLATLGISGSDTVGSRRPSPFHADWTQLSLEFLVGASDMTSKRFAIYPTITASHRASMSFARPKLQLLGVKE